MNNLDRCAIRLIVILVAVSGTALALAGQSALNRTPGTAQSMVSANTNQMNSDSPALQSRNPRYQVTRDDVLSVSFPLVPEFNQKVTVQPDGYITLENLGSVYIQGMTVPEVTETLKRAYANVLHDPTIDVDLVDFQRPYFIVSGQVGKPGQYDLRPDITVSEAIGVAGGFLPTAKTQVFVYHRVSSGWLEVKKLSLKDLLNGKNVNEDVQIQPGDMVFVPEKFIVNFKKYVPYTAGVYANPVDF
jgi:polysaccharide export outer membrane protein